MKRLLAAGAAVLLAASLPTPAGEAGKHSPGDRPAVPHEEAAPGGEAPAGDQAKPDAMDTVRQFVRAFNHHDPEAMIRHLTEEVQWLQIDGAEISVQATGPGEVKRAMESYFEAVPSARAVMEESMVSGRYVVFRERAHWEASGQATQSALAVYEMKGDLIHRVWYFPAEK